MKRACFFVFIALALLSGGCGDLDDVNQRVLVDAVGLDSGDAPGQVRVTIQYVARGPQSGGTGGVLSGSPKPQETPVEFTTVAGSVAQALQAIRGEAPGELFLGSVRLFLIGQELASQGVQRELDYLVRQPVIPTTVPVVAVDGSAAEFLRQPVKAERSPAFYVDRIIGPGGKNAPSRAAPEFYQFFDRAFGTGAIWLPLFTQGTTGPTEIGLAVFQNGREATTVPLDEAPLLASVHPGGSVLIGLPPPSGKTWPVNLRFRRLSTSARVDAQAGVVEVTMRGSAYIVENPNSGVSRETIQNEAQTLLPERMSALLQRLYENGADVLDLTEQVREHTKNGVVPADWPPKLPRLHFRVTADITILHGLRGAL